METTLTPHRAQRNNSFIAACVALVLSWLPYLLIGPFALVPLVILAGLGVLSWFRPRAGGVSLILLGILAGLFGAFVGLWGGTIWWVLGIGFVGAAPIVPGSLFLISRR
jgi:hypothetical protein